MLVILGVIVWWIIDTSGKTFCRKNIDDYVAATPAPEMLNHGASAYFDFSNGMNHAYASEQSRQVLSAVLNKTTGTSGAISFFSLADRKIEPLNLSQTEVYNRIVNPGSYTQQMAPIEDALKHILSDRKPALLVTDYEEYKGAVIEQQAYAKDYFIKWIADGNMITFYKLDFNENGKAKHLYFTVFDDNMQSLNSAIAQAMEPFLGQGVERFTLGGKNFPFALAHTYPSADKGGSYHNTNGTDAVSGVIEKGGPEDYKRYSGEMALRWEGSTAGQYDLVAMGNKVGGLPVEYYPLSVRYADILENARLAKELPEESRYSYFLSGLFVNFTGQDGYVVDGVEAAVFDMDGEIAAFADSASPTDSVLSRGFTPSSNLPQVADMLTASLIKNDGDPGWNEIAVDFSQNFKGEVKGAAQSALLKCDVIISDARICPESRLKAFFAWPGNESLFASVVNTLQSREVNPEGHILYTYFIKNLAE